MALTSGTRFGPYEIQSPLGAGGTGEVYRARDTRLEREVAIKVLPANLSSDTSLRQRLEREAKAISRLSHPNICTLHDIGHQHDVDFLVMEYLEGHAHQKWRQADGLWLGEAIEYIVAVQLWAFASASAICAAYRRVCSGGNGPLIRRCSSVSGVVADRQRDLVHGCPSDNRFPVVRSESFGQAAGNSHHPGAHAFDGHRGRWARPSHQ
jgi:Protein kinase domain